LAAKSKRTTTSLSQRVLASPDISKETKKWLRKEFAKLNPAELKRQISRLQQKLLKIASAKRKQNTM
jgi:hypothetical protein